MSGSRAGCRYAELLSAMENVDLVLAVTGPDRPRGRGRKTLRCFIAGYCDRTGLTGYQTDDVNSADSLSVIKQAGADVAFVVDFGQILSKKTLDLFPSGCYNLHYSVLPDLRGAAPVRWALIRGYDKTGVTLMEMNEKVDAGGILLTKEVEIRPQENHDLLKDRLTTEGLRLTESFFNQLASGKKPLPVSQPESGVSSAPKIRGGCRINWQESAQMIVNLNRGMSPVPGCGTRLVRKSLYLKLLSLRVAEDAEALEPGRVSRVTKKSFSVSAADASVEVLSLQPEGKRVMTSEEFLAGNPLEKGDLFE